MTGYRIDTDYNGTDNTASNGTAAVTAQQPTGIAGGFNFSRAYFQVTNTVENIGCGSRPGVNKTVRVAAVLSDGSVTASVSKNVFMMPAGIAASAYNDYPYMYGRSQVAPGFAEHR